MKPVKVLVLILLAIGLIRYNQPLSGADAKSGEAKPVDTKAQDIADLKAVEDRFMTAFRAKDVNAIMELCVPDESLVVFDMTPPRQRNGAYVSSIHHVTGTMKGGKKVDYTVRVTDGLKKINGKWLIAHTHVSFPVDMRTGQADIESKP